MWRDNFSSALPLQKQPSTNYPDTTKRWIGLFLFKKYAPSDHAKRRRRKKLFGNRVKSSSSSVSSAYVKLLLIDCVNFMTLWWHISHFSIRGNAEEILPLQFQRFSYGNFPNHCD
jgi:hypothetical protein